MVSFFKDCAVIWQFRNGSIWEQAFNTSAERDHWINRVGLVSHPDIVSVTIREDGGAESDLKGKRPYS